MNKIGKLNQTGEQNQIIKRYILHFDLNKTIILSDTAKDASKDEILHQVLCDYAWGKLDDKDQWKLMHNVFTVNKPNPEWVSYREYVQKIFPLTSEPEATEQEQKEKREQMLAKRKEFYSNFVKQGNPGNKMKPDYEKILKQLNLPRQVIDELKISKDLFMGTGVQSQTMMQTKQNQTQLEDDVERHELVELFKDGKYFILPYFFKLLINLKKNKKDFSIVFRTFGEDLTKVVDEMNQFSSGSHPCFNGKGGLPMARFDGSKNSKNLLIDSNMKALIHRNPNNKDQIQSVFGTLNRHKLGQQQELEEVYDKELDEDMVDLQKSPNQLYLKIQESLKESSCIAIHDDYEPWKTNNHSSDFGKPLLIDQQDYSTLQIFFDDNIQEEENIVDIRDIVTNQKIPYKKAINKYLVKVHPLSCIRDPDYFMKCIKECEQNRLEEIEKIERGEEIVDDEVEVQQEDLWAKLQNQFDSDYLRNTIMPLLYPALYLVDRERPDDPITQIAMYMLKNKEKVFIPEPLPQKVEKVEKEENENQEASHHSQSQHDLQ